MTSSKQVFKRIRSKSFYGLAVDRQEYCFTKDFYGLAADRQKKKFFTEKKYFYYYYFFKVYFISKFVY